MSKLFKSYSQSDLVELIESYPLALMISDGPAGFQSTPLPMLPDTDADGRLINLLGHMSLANPQVSELKADPRAYFLFQGPHGYISPTFVTDRTWAPTWNYIMLRVHAEISFRPDLNDIALRRLVAKMEAGRKNAWCVEEMGERYQKLAEHITAFNATVHSVDATFKMSQDEKPVIFKNILSGLDHPELEKWMLRFENRKKEF